MNNDTPKIPSPFTNGVVINLACKGNNVCNDKIGLLSKNCHNTISITSANIKTSARRIAKALYILPGMFHELYLVSLCHQ